MVSENNKRIAKNTGYLYIRMLLTLVVSLYTSRVLLRALGIEDYGIYGVVGSLVASFNFLSASMAGATSRFMAVEIGKRNDGYLNVVFNISLICHVTVAFIIGVLAETIGIWFFYHYLIIPPSRLDAAFYVFQLSLVGALLKIIQVPYQSILIAREKMEWFSVIEIVSTLLLLIVALLIEISIADKLITYAILILLVCIMVYLLYLYCCHKNFNECRIRPVWDGKLFKNMISYTGWNLYGNMSDMARNQGVALLINVFFGPTMNAATSVATQVGAAVMLFTNNITTAVKPQIIKYYAACQYVEMAKLMSNAVKVNIVIISCLTVPLLLELNYILDLWLIIVPDYTASFCALVLIFNFFACISSVVITGIHATGNIKSINIVLGTMYLMVVPISYLIFNFYSNPVVPFVVNAIFVVVGMLYNAYLVSERIKTFRLRDFLKKDLMNCMAITIVAIIFLLLLQQILNEGLARLTLAFMLSTSVIAIGTKSIFPSLLSTVIDNFKTNYISKCKYE